MLGTGERVDSILYMERAVHVCFVFGLLHGASNATGAAVAFHEARFVPVAKPLAR